MELRKKGAKAVAAGLMCWAINIVLILTMGGYGPTLVILGSLGVFFGGVSLVWGDSFHTMSVAQKIPAVLIVLAVVVGAAVGLLRWVQALGLH